MDTNMSDDGIPSPDEDWMRDVKPKRKKKRSFVKKKTLYEMVEDPITKTKRIKCDMCENTYSHHPALRDHRLKIHGLYPIARKNSRHANSWNNEVPFTKVETYTEELQNEQFVELQNEPSAELQNEQTEELQNEQTERKTLYLDDNSMEPLIKFLPKHESLDISETEICENNIPPNDAIINHQQFPKEESILIASTKTTTIEDMSCTQIVIERPQIEYFELAIPKDDTTVNDSSPALTNPNSTTKPKRRNINECNRTCGYIKVSDDYCLFSMNCFFCDDAYPVTNWRKFIRHLREVHQDDEEESLRIELLASQDNEKPLLTVKKNLFYNSESELIEEDNSNNISDNENDINRIEVDTNEVVENYDVLENNDILENDFIAQNVDIDGNPYLLSDFEPSESEYQPSSEDEDCKKKIDEYKKKGRRYRPLKLPCFLCNELFRDTRYLESHQRKAHNLANLPANQIRPRKQENRHCDVCNTTFKHPSYYRKHIAVHRPPSFKCDICEKTFRWQHSYNDHMLKHSNSRDHICELCGASFFCFSRLRAHQKQVHLSKKPQRPNDNNKENDMADDKKNEKAKKNDKQKEKAQTPFTLDCSVCGKRFPTKLRLRVHELRKHKLKKRLPKNPQNSPNTDPVELHCNICETTFKHASSLVKHMMVHKPPNHKCKICGREFRWVQSFKDHLKMHSNQRDHICEICGASFFRLFRLREHKKVKHAEEMNYTCAICNYICKTATQLSVHRRKRHLVLEGTIEELMDHRPRPKKPRRTFFQAVQDPVTKTKRIKCDLCDTTYSHHPALRYHRYKIHGKLPNEKEKPIRPSKKKSWSINNEEHKMEISADEIDLVRHITSDYKISPENEEEDCEMKTNLAEQNGITSEHMTNFVITELGEIITSTDEQFEDLIVYEEEVDSEEIRIVECDDYFENND